MFPSYNLDSRFRRESPSRGNPLEDYPTLCEYVWAKCSYFLKMSQTILAFTMLMCGLALTQGLAVSYFRETAKIWTKRYALSSTFEEWFIYVDDMFGSAFALIIAHFGYRIHRTKCLAVLAILYSVGSIGPILLELYYAPRSIIRDFAAGNTTGDMDLCDRNPALAQIPELPTHGIGVAIVVLVLYQLLFSLSTVSFLTLGITYVDDHSKNGDGAIYIGIIIGCRELGKQMGVFLSWIPAAMNPNAVFSNSVWIATACSVFVIGMLIYKIFPKRLPCLDCVIDDNQEEVNNAGNRMIWPAICNIFTVKHCVLLFHVLAFVIANVVSANFNMVQKHFLRAKTFIPDYEEDEDPFQYTQAFQERVTVELLKQIYVITVAISSGIIVSKFHSQFRHLVFWNMMILVALTLFYALTYFLHCDFTRKGSILIHNDAMIKLNGTGTVLDYYCNEGCNCEANIRFSPVCTDDGSSYFSPCHAGCTSLETINDVMYYTDCSCGRNSSTIANTTATPGSCYKRECTTLSTLLRIGAVACYGITTSTVVPFIFVLLNHVRRAHKGIALGLTYMLLGIITYFPFKLAAFILVDWTCQLFHNEKCLLHTEVFHTWVSGVAFIVSVMATICAWMVYKIMNRLETPSKTPQTPVRRERRRYYDEPLLGEEIDPEDMRASSLPRNRDSDSSSINVPKVTEVRAQVYGTQTPNQQSSQQDSVEDRTHKSTGTQSSLHGSAEDRTHKSTGTQSSPQDSTEDRTLSSLRSLPYSQSSGDKSTAI